ncbi:MAG: hypothetical protein ABJC13_10840 [Acidobacteriota bacterium]
MSNDRRKPPKDPVDSKGDGELAPLAPVLGAAWRFRPKSPSPVDPGIADPPADEERRAAVGEFLGDLAHTLAARGEAEVGALLDRSEHERRQALRDRPELGTQEIAAYLLVRCRADWLDEPDGAVDTARLAIRLLSDEVRNTDLTPNERAALLAFSCDHLAAAERIALRADELRRRRGPRPQRPEVPEGDTYPMGTSASSPLSEVAEDALAVEVEAALDDLRDASLDRGRPYEAALVVLDRARLALDRGGAEGLEEIAQAEAERFLDPHFSPVPREALRRLAFEAGRGTADLDLLFDLTGILIAAQAGFLR